MNDDREAKWVTALIAIAMILGLCFLAYWINPENKTCAERGGKIEYINCRKVLAINTNRDCPLLSLRRSACEHIIAPKFEDRCEEHCSID